jgi:hypothetical protein
MMVILALEGGIISRSQGTLEMDYKEACFLFIFLFLLQILNFAQIYST